MASKIKRPCAYPGCPELVSTGRYCEKHQKQYWRQQDEKRGSAASRGYDVRWRRIREMVLKEEPLCRECMRQGRVTPATDVHHVNGDVRDVRRENLEPLCHSCHSRHTAKEQAFGRKGVGGCKSL
ncbi:HNH endonuclease signature motif containing protein [Thermosyntropha sp.]|uniref:HNH endonuclease n=1 Tax=Thermosyntropha sp. TaxID=2740820 RepID=UPI0025E866F4|nr:HNH endonuclease signature motif containing protein [Thermosyntropha sp.]MBO8158841.1 HNH endonuclease [Thermosyntropha sp.]